jgi:NAD(P)H-dependent FMN reductase
MNKFIIVSGSHRVRGASGWIAQAMGELAEEHLPDGFVKHISLDKVPLWDEGLWGDPKDAPQWNAWRGIADELRTADGFIMVAPEYAGMVPPRLSNFLLLCSGEELGHKPALAVAVSASRGGTYPIAQLRAFSSKNNQLCWLPEHLILRNVPDDGPPPTLRGTGFEARYAVHCLKLLDRYATALKGVRAGADANAEAFPYGM